MRAVIAIIFLSLVVACTHEPDDKKIKQHAPDSVVKNVPVKSSDTSDPLYINTGATTPQQLITYAQTLAGAPYLYASSNPAKGFDCSGFITYVFNHFHIVVPRSSVNFTNVPHEISETNAKPADLILFTGTDSTVRTVGHMGIIIQNLKDSIFFIHSTSGKANGVTITPLNDYYKGRFVKVIRIFPQNDL